MPLAAPARLQQRARKRSGGITPSNTRENVGLFRRIRFHLLLRYCTAGAELHFAAIRQIRGQIGGGVPLRDALHRRNRNGPRTARGPSVGNRARALAFFRVAL